DRVDVEALIVLADVDTRELAFEQQIGGGSAYQVEPDGLRVRRADVVSNEHRNLERVQIQLVGRVVGLFRRTPVVEEFGHDGPGRSLIASDEHAKCRAQAVADRVVERIDVTERGEYQAAFDSEGDPSGFFWRQCCLRRWRRSLRGGVENGRADGRGRGQEPD